MKCTDNCTAKLERMKKALRHQEGDRVPISGFFRGSFLKRSRDELGLARDTDIYRYYDLDWMNFNSNLYPHIKPLEILREDDSRTYQTHKDDGAGQGIRALPNAGSINERAGAGQRKPGTGPNRTPSPRAFPHGCERRWCA